MREARMAILCALVAACDPAVVAPTDAGRVERDAAVSDTSTPIEDAGGDDDAWVEPDAGPPDTTRDAFLANLDRTVWSGRATRDESGTEVERGFEMHFQGGGAPMWGEIRNPYGPARLRILRYLRIAAGACTSEVRCEVTTTITIPDATWETPSALRGRSESWTIEILDGSPRAIAITNASSGIEEVFDEGWWSEPTSGLNAEVRVFQGGAGHPISDAFCTSGAIFSSDIDRAAIWDFARGVSAEPTLGEDLAAGVLFGEWNDVDNRFGVRDVEGFGVADLGGSERTDQFFFLVRYRGILDHPGGRLQLREADDSVEDAVWAFVGDGTGSTSLEDLFLEVHHFAPPDETVDAPSIELPAGDVPIEIIVPRCEMNFEASGQVRVEMRLGDGAYELLSRQPIRPYTDVLSFPSVL